MAHAASPTFDLLLQGLDVGIGFAEIGRVAHGVLVKEIGLLPSDGTRLRNKVEYEQGMCVTYAKETVLVFVQLLEPVDENLLYFVVGERFQFLVDVFDGSVLPFQRV